MAPLPYPTQRPEETPAVAYHIHGQRHVAYDAVGGRGAGDLYGTGGSRRAADGYGTGGGYEAGGGYGVAGGRGAGDGYSPGGEYEAAGGYGSRGYDDGAGARAHGGDGARAADGRGDPGAGPEPGRAPGEGPPRGEGARVEARARAHGAPGQGERGLSVAYARAPIVGGWGGRLGGVGASLLSWKVWLVIGDCVLIGLAPVLAHMGKDERGRFAFDPVLVNLWVEVCKSVFAAAMIAFARGRGGGGGGTGPAPWSSPRDFIRLAQRNRALAVPALLYAVNNSLKFALQGYLRPTTAKMVSNLKIIVIALLMRSVLGRRFSIFQWEALFLLVAGVTVHRLGENAGACAPPLAPLAAAAAAGRGAAGAALAAADAAGADVAGADAAAGAASIAAAAAAAAAAGLGGAARRLLEVGGVGDSGAADLREAVASAELPGVTVDVWSLGTLVVALGTLTVPSLASVYNEAALKRDPHAPVLVQNLYLYLFGVGFNLVAVLASRALDRGGAAARGAVALAGRLARDGPPSRARALGLLEGAAAAGAAAAAADGSPARGLSTVACLLILNNSLQGILSSFFFKFADTILKKYSSTIATVLTAILSAVLFHHPLSPAFCVGVSIVFISMHIFFSAPSADGPRDARPGAPRAPARPRAPSVTRFAVSPSMDHLSLAGSGASHVALDALAAPSSRAGLRVAGTPAAGHAALGRGPDAPPLGHDGGFPGRTAGVRGYGSRGQLLPK